MTFKLTTIETLSRPFPVPVQRAATAAPSGTLSLQELRRAVAEMVG